MLQEAGALNGIEYLEVSDSEAPIEALRQRTLFVRLLQPPARAHGRQRPHRRRRAHRRRSAVEWAAPADALPPATDPALVAGLEDPRHAARAHRARRRLLALHAASRRGARAATQPPAGFDPLLVAVEFSFKVECPTDFDCARVRAVPARAASSRRRSTTSPRTTRSFRRLMLDRLSLLAPGWTRAHRRRPRRRARRAAGVRRRRAVVPPGRDRHRGVPRHRAPARLGAPPRPAGRLRDARRLQRARLGARARSTATTSPARGHAAADAQRRACPTRLAPGSREHARRARRRRADVRDGARRRRCFTRPQPASTSTPGATAAAACRAARRARRSRGDHPELRAGDVLVFAEVRGPDDRHTRADADRAQR